MMKKKKIRVTVVFNGSEENSAIDPLDIISETAVKEEAEDVFKALQEQGYIAERAVINHFPSDFIRIAESKPDVIFNLCEGYRGSARYEMHVAGIWELLGTPYTGNTPLTLGLAQNKALTKNLFEVHGIPTPAYQVFSREPRECLLDYPLITKPAEQDASLGITPHSVVHDFSSLQKRVTELLEKYQQPVLVEEFIEGREFNIGILGETSQRILPISEISFAALDENQPHITSYEAKWLPDHPLYQRTPAICPTEVDEDLEERLQKIALKVFTLLNGRDYGRVDVRVDAEDHIFVLEFNPNPDISAGAGFANAARAAGYSYSEMIHYLINEALKRQAV
ncbi:MAG: ATP-grasp domain-containing protein [Calditrichaeota bacterium]|nr:ATP-grasp domain-containing protein [Calditrichota bacterium]RQW08032.1 MAG: ATP-grasp domain-containing protein [Calditrichota bacterium]